MSRLFVPATGFTPGAGVPPSPGAQPSNAAAAGTRLADSQGGSRHGAPFEPAVGTAVVGSLRPVVSPVCTCAALQKPHLGVLPSAPGADAVMPLASCGLGTGKRQGMLGEIVSGPGGVPAVKALEILDDPGQPRPVVLSIAANAGVPFAFPQAVQDAAARVYRRALSDIRDPSCYQDWQAVPFVTVDDP
ncbi:MAG TPA: hypothetical protein VFH51_01450, partial [Myxococcota bacterium]|nr:hypothetical protein [Myxococcota bacterium]